MIYTLIKLGTGTNTELENTEQLFMSAYSLRQDSFSQQITICYQNAAMTNAFKTCLKTALVSVAFKYRRVHGTLGSDAWLTVSKKELIKNEWEFW